MNNVFTLIKKNVERNMFRSNIKRRVIVIHAHPVLDKSYSASLLNEVRSGLLAGGHDVRVKRLYFNPKYPDESYDHKTFSAILTEEEHEAYFEDKFICSQVQEAADDLQWCNSVMLVYPTVMINSLIIICSMFFTMFVVFSGGLIFRLFSVATSTGFLSQRFLCDQA
jgi:FMN-dependent NADH-azoreductase